MNTLVNNTFIFIFFIKTVSTYDSFSFLSFLSFSLNNWTLNFLFIYLLSTLILKFNSFTMLFVILCALFFYVDLESCYYASKLVKTQTYIVELLDGLIQFHPPFFYASAILLIFIFICMHGYQRIFFSVSKLLAFKLSFFLFFFSIIGLLSGGYWSYLQFSWGRWWLWDPIEFVLLGFFLLSVHIIHNTIFFSSKLSFLLYLEFFMCAILLALAVRLGFVNSRHSFFGSTAISTFFNFFRVYLFTLFFLICIICLDLFLLLSELLLNKNCYKRLVYFKSYINLGNLFSNFIFIKNLSIAAILIVVSLHYNSFFLLAHTDVLHSGMGPWLTRYTLPLVGIILLFFFFLIMPTNLFIFFHITYISSVVWLFILYNLSYKISSLSTNLRKGTFNPIIEFQLSPSMLNSLFMLENFKNQSSCIAIKLDLGFFFKIRPGNYFSTRPLDLPGLHSFDSNVLNQIFIKHKPRLGLLYNRWLFDHSLTLDNPYPYLNNSLKTIFSNYNLYYNTRSIGSSLYLWSTYILVNVITTYFFGICFFFFCIICSYL